ncbi:putative DoxD-like, integral membrane protein [Saccharolobus shibatae B12]|uniref:DoxD-like, integral membrane protein n=1 Tax=Saccharolobus shibatae (strain ATCC 51178 / DSM 5389 / JCM 8931 / NBRC 15437 / B12) TaxID=523848 RepID=A0A8F5GSN6_SACSH|nr:TQO small subunit DoxD [Saccharolobus shibatae]QXJ27527.1 putative DoxD-like, integral membrane protein [Saccharolobus shibatae B12]
MAKIMISDNFTLILRISMASIWLYAGILGKLLNSGFLNPSSEQYVGFTIQYLAQGSIIRQFLYIVAMPHPVLVGTLVMIGEICFGFLTLIGLMTRLSSVVAFCTNLIYFLSASWTGAEEYGLNLLMMTINAYMIAYGSGNFSIDSLISRKFNIIDNKILWIVVGSVIYIAVIVYLTLV